MRILVCSGALLGFLLVGCEKKPIAARASGPLSSPSTATAVESPAVETPARKVVRPPPVRRRLATRDWRDDPPDAGLDTARRRGVGAPAEGGKPTNVVSEAEKKRVETERLVDSALQRVANRMKECFVRAKMPPGETRISMKVHRSGYLMSPSVATANSQVSSCMKGILDSVRIPSPPTPDLQIERTLQFTSRTIRTPKR